MKIARFVFQLFGINTYVVWDPETRKGAIIDPGMSSRKEEEVLSSFLKREAIELTNLINTHMHIDHVAGNGFVMKEYGLKVLGHKLDEPLAANINQQAKMFMLDFEPTGIEISTYLQEGDIVNIGNGELHVLHVPGHSPGSIVLYDKEGGFILSGDTLFQNSIGRTDLPGGSTPQLIDAINKKLFTLPPSTIVYPGHGNPTTIEEERRHNPFLL